MKAVLIATDLIKNESGDIKVLETNTNAWTTHNFSLFDFSGLTNFIENNNFSEVHFIVQNFNRTLTPYIQQIAESKNATFTEYIVENTAITVPYVEDSESKLIIRLSYDTTAVIDDDYCRDKYKLQKLIHEQSYAIDTYVPTEFDDFEKNCNVIDSVLQQKSVINISEEAIVISTYPVLSSIIETTKECILALKETGRKIILTSHVPIPIELQELVDYCVYDKNNIFLNGLLVIICN